MQERLQRKEAQLSESALEMSDKQRQLAALGDVSSQLSVTQAEKSSLEATIQEMQQRLSLLAQTEEQLQGAQDQLKNNSTATEELKLVNARCAELEAEINRLGQIIKDLEAEEFVTQQGRQAALEQVSRLENNIKALEDQLVHDEEAYEKMIADLREEKA